MTFAKEDVKKMSGPQLVEAHNKLSETKVKRFANREAGVRRVLALLGDGPEGVTGKRSPAKPRTSEIKAGENHGEPREGSKRAAILALTDRKSGATRSEIAEAAGWKNQEKVREAMRIIASRHGRTVTEEDGVIRTSKAA